AGRGDRPVAGALAGHLGRALRHSLDRRRHLSRRDRRPAGRRARRESASRAPRRARRSDGRAADDLALLAAHGALPTNPSPGCKRRVVQTRQAPGSGHERHETPKHTENYGFVFVGFRVSCVSWPASAGDLTYWAKAGSWLRTQGLGLRSSGWPVALRAVRPRPLEVQRFLAATEPSRLDY